MEAGIETTGKGKGKGKGAGGRIAPDGQEAVRRPEVVAKRIEALETLARRQQEAGKDLSEAIKACAEESGYNAAAVRRLVSARLGDAFAERKRDAEQQLELFEDVGER